MEKPPRKLNRRDFFGEFVGRWLRPVAEITAEASSRGGPSGFPFSAQQTVLRPPGALPEREFLQTCLHSGNCVDSCPANAIWTYRGEDENLIGTPDIDPKQQPCVVCDSLACMNACPSGALKRVEVDDIQMGVALWIVERCVRAAGEACVQCVEKCPLGHRAIALGDSGRIDIQPGCIGCGVCQYVCPVDAMMIVAK